MADRVAALIPAAGSGERLGRGPKAFVELGDRPLLAWTLDAMTGWSDEVVVAVPTDAVDRARGLAPAVQVVAGGATRQETVARLLDRTTADWVLVHDAARPFLPRGVRIRVVEAARACGAATASLALRDTVVDATSGETVDRSRLRAVQTPQVFARELLVEAHRRAHARGTTATDDTMLVRSMGARVELVEGSPWLLKITTPDDLELAEGLLAVWRDA